MIKIIVFFFDINNLLLLQMSSGLMSVNVKLYFRGCMFLNIYVFVIVVCRQLIHLVHLLFLAFFYWTIDYNLLDQSTIFFTHTFDN
jgi:hypothetical protein